MIETEFFVNNRVKLLQNFEGTAPIVIIGNCLMQRSRDAAYDFVQDSNFWYLTGVEEPGYVLVIDNGQEYLIAPKTNHYQEIFHEKNDYDKVIKTSGVIKIYDYDTGMEKLIKRVCKSVHLATIQPSLSYVEDLYMFTNPSKTHLLKKMFKANSQLKLIDLGKILASLRSRKTSNELGMIAQAISHTAKLQAIFSRKLSSSQNESDLLMDAKKYLLKNDLEFAYDPIIANGENAITLHYTQNNSKIDHKEFTLIDAAVKSTKYAADITRTYVANPTKRQAKVYETVALIQSFAIDMLKPGITLKDYEEGVRKYAGEKLRELGLIKSIDKDMVARYYPHATSHFLGIDVHDVGLVDQPLDRGMVLTVEPGIYIPEEKIGIRIEDDIVITEDGAEVLSTNIPK